MIVLLPHPPALSAAGPVPRILAPAPRQTSFGHVIVKLAPGTTRVRVFVGKAMKVERATTGSRFKATIALPRRDTKIRVVAFNASGASREDSVGQVYGLPRSAFPRGTLNRLDPVLQRRLRNLASTLPGITAFYVVNLRTGIGAAWNAKARFPAASTVKIAIAIAVMRELRGIPQPGSRLAMLLRTMLENSSNEAANELLEWLGGSQTRGASKVDAMLDTIHVGDTYLYSGYILGTSYSAQRPIPLNVVARPSFAGKYTSAWDLAKLHRYLHLATAGTGPLVHRLGGFSSSDARSLLYLLCHSADHGKLDLYVRGPGVAVPHKAGWISTARHDAGIVYFPGGGFVMSVMTWNGNGISTTSDVLAGRMAKAALDRYRALLRSRPGMAPDRGTAF
ncbi:MAG TPA: serine hydrolase [Gaiellaceae bacterium]